MNIYDGSMAVSEGLKRYFQLYNLGSGGYDKPTFKIRIWKGFRITLPNTKGRIEAVKLHDIHHVLNEYKTKLKGEAEIGAWEIGSGCGKYYAAWLLNFGAILYGIFLWPSMTFTAFVKGRRCLNLYHGTEYNDKLLNMSVGELRNKLGIGKEIEKVNITDILSYSFWVLLSLFILFVSIGAFYCMNKVFL